LTQDERRIAKDFYEAGRKEVDAIKQRWDALTEKQRDRFSALKNKYHTDVLDKFYALDIRHDEADQQYVDVRQKAMDVIEELRILARETEPVSFVRQSEAHDQLERGEFKINRFYDGQTIEDANRRGVLRTRPYHEGLHERDAEFRQEYEPMLRDLEEMKTNFTPAERELYGQAIQQWAEFTQWANGIYRARKAFVSQVEVDNHFDAAEDAIARLDYLRARQSERFRGGKYEDRAMERQWKRIASDNVRALTSTTGSGKFRNESYIAIPQVKDFRFIDSKGNAVDNFLIGIDREPRGKWRLFLPNRDTGKPLPRLELRSYLGRMTFEPRRDARDPRLIRYELTEKVDARNLEQDIRALDDAVQGRSGLSADERARFIASTIESINRYYAQSGLSVGENWERALSALPQEHRQSMTEVIRLDANGRSLEANTATALARWREEENRPWDPAKDGVAGLSDAQVHEWLNGMAQSGDASAARQLRRLDTYVASKEQGEIDQARQNETLERSRSDQRALGALIDRISLQTGMLVGPFIDGTVGEQSQTVSKALNGLNESRVAWNTNQHIGPDKTPNRQPRTAETDRTSLRAYLQTDDQRSLFDALVTVQEGKLALGDVRAEIARRGTKTEVARPVAQQPSENGKEVMVSINSPTASVDHTLPDSKSLSESTQQKTVPERVSNIAAVLTGPEVTTLRAKLALPESFIRFDDNLVMQLRLTTNEADHQMHITLRDVEELSKGGSTAAAVHGLERAFTSTLLVLAYLDTAIDRAAAVHAQRFGGLSIFPSPALKRQTQELLQLEKQVKRNLRSVHSLMKKIGGDRAVEGIADPSVIAPRNMEKLGLQAAFATDVRGEFVGEYIENLRKCYNLPALVLGGKNGPRIEWPDRT
jgi:hypothetical protein